MKIIDVGQIKILGPPTSPIHSTPELMEIMEVGQIESLVTHDVRYNIRVEDWML